jgi:hypothetical protein
MITKAELKISDDRPPDEESNLNRKSYVKIVEDTLIELKNYIDLEFTLNVRELKNFIGRK